MTVETERPTIVLAVCGSIAAYKGAWLARALIRRGVNVQAMMTQSASQFLGKATLLGITGREVLDSLFDGGPGERHVEVWRNAKGMLIAPATADVLARLALGQACDLVSAAALCRTGPLWVAPAMHPSMWNHPAVRRNVERLKADGVRFFGPVDGEVASGEHGPSRMMDPEEIAERTVAELLESKPRDLAGKRVVITAGPTVEDLDPVRFLSNRSSGKMGYALAAAANARGAHVDLVSGPVALDAPLGVTRHWVRSARDLELALAPLCANADALIMAAAVADYRPRELAHSKLKKDPAAAGALTLDLVQNPDVIANIGARRTGSRPALIAFAVETGSDEEIAALATEKLLRKKVDCVVANAASDGFEGEENRVQIVDGHGVTALPRMSKRQLADQLLDRLVQLLLPGAAEKDR